MLASDPEPEDAIWNRVLSFVYAHKEDRLLAWYSHGDHNYDFSDYGPHRDLDEDDWMNQPPIGARPLLVYKRFQRLATPYLSSQQILRWGQHARHVRLYEEVHQAGDTAKLLSHFPRLRSLAVADEEDRVIPPWDVFDELSVRCGATLDTFEGVGVAKSKKAVDPVIFSRFAEMKFFAWDSETVFDTAEDGFSDAFQNLEQMAIREADASFYMILARMELPSLRCVILTATETSKSHVFFSKHGGKLERLALLDATLNADVFNYCPSIKHLSMTWDWASSRRVLNLLVQFWSHQYS
ncbi:hypothetical protein FB45DRAFT_1041826 [Roridomyces roridus]|uniref:Uncharacterized protein n=1 Tax=Roridomyces roridus TaxID=1738132 RepID=A0AAD7AZT4_9AGAR|nr:hypothetical protein FB45DRAFT_1041826 [Roridomyces roridus]